MRKAFVVTGCNPRTQPIDIGRPQSRLVTTARTSASSNSAALPSGSSAGTCRNRRCVRDVCGLRGARAGDAALLGATPPDGEGGVLNKPRGRSRRPMRSINTKINHRLVLARNERRAPGRGRFERPKLRLAHKRSSLTSSASRSARFRRHESDRQFAPGTHSLANVSSGARGFSAAATIDPSSNSSERANRSGSRSSLLRRRQPVCVGMTY